PYEQVHLGVGAVSMGNVLVGFYGKWYDRPDFNDIHCDLGLVVGNDGLFFREPVKGHVWLRSMDSPCTPAAGTDRQYHTILCQCPGIINVGDTTRIYHGRWLMAWGKDVPVEHYGGDVGLATIPRDRWGALGVFPSKTEGSVISAPVTLPANATLTL